MTYICNHGHKHHTETGVEYCHVETPWRELESQLGDTDHPANLISFCHDHHRIQPVHHYNAGLVICDADIPVTPFLPRRIRQARPSSETTLFDFVGEQETS